ncbi:MAG: hypothetical protein M9931_07310 [Chitinophagales bacterium]|nr:hypothetical protein [Chitinophagales bacterium]
MKNIFTILLAFTFITTVSSCKKEEITPSKRKTGSLVVNVRDGIGNSVVGYSVYLYVNQADFINRLYSDKATTNSSGQVKFSELSPRVYYVACNYKTVGGSTVRVEGNAAVSAGYQTTITIRP